MVMTSWLHIDLLKVSYLVSALDGCLLLPLLPIVPLLTPAGKTFVLGSSPCAPSDGQARPLDNSSSETFLPSGVHSLTAMG